MQRYDFLLKYTNHFEKKKKSNYTIAFGAVNERVLEPHGPSTRGDIRGNWMLFYCPSFAGENHVAQRLEVLASTHFCYLLLNGRVVGGSVDIADYTNGQGEGFAVHHGELLVEEVGLAVGIVYEHVVDGVAIFADCHCFEAEAVLHQAAVVVLAEEHFFAVAEVDCAVGAHFFVGDGVVDTVVEDHAVLEDFAHSRAVVFGGGYHHFLAGGEFYVDGAGEESAARAEH